MASPGAVSPTVLIVALLNICAIFPSRLHHRGANCGKGQWMEELAPEEGQRFICKEVKEAA